MALNKRHMQTIIRRNGHLEMDGSETTQELKMALLYLWHSHPICHVKGGSIGIRSLIPDISVLEVRSTKHENVSADIPRTSRGRFKSHTQDIVTNKL